MHKMFFLGFIDWSKFAYACLNVVDSSCNVLTISHMSPIALGVQQPSLLGASPMYTQQSALAAASLNTQSAANYQLSQQTAVLQQQAAAAAAAALQQVRPWL